MRESTILIALSPCNRY